MKILMVCLGNICRSPLAQGVLESKNSGIFVDSAGFEAFHQGDPPDTRAQRTARNHGIDISGQRQRLFRVEDFDKFDKIYVMDEMNYRDVSREARYGSGDMEKVDYILNEIYPGENRSVPDPYYGGQDGFEKVYEMLDAACDRIVSKYRNI